MIKRTDGWLAARVGDEMVMMSAKGDAYIGLNDVGACVWELLEAPMEIEAICEGVAEAFETTPQACRADVEAFLAELETTGAIARAG